MPGTQHPYLLLSLQTVGIIVALYLLVTHLWMLLKPAQSQAFLGGAHRNDVAGYVTMAIGMLWFWLIVGPDGGGVLGKITMDLGESPGGFNGLKPWLRLLIPIVLVGLCMFVKEYLFVRGLGLTMLMAAAPILGAAFQKDPTSRLLLVIFAYALIMKGLFFVGLPYMFRDAVTWARKSEGRWKACALGGVVYGALILICALAFWGGH